MVRAMALAVPLPKMVLAMDLGIALLVFFHLIPVCCSPVVVAVTAAETEATAQEMAPGMVAPDRVMAPATAQATAKTS